MLRVCLCILVVLSSFLTLGEAASSRFWAYTPDPKGVGPSQYTQNRQVPTGRAGAATWNLQSTGLMFGGFGVDDTGQRGYLNDMWTVTRHKDTRYIDWSRAYPGAGGLVLANTSDPSVCTVCVPVTVAPDTVAAPLPSIPTTTTPSGVETGCIPPPRQHAATFVLTAENAVYAVLHGGIGFGCSGTGFTDGVLGDTWVLCITPTCPAGWENVWVLVSTSGPAVYGGAAFMRLQGVGALVGGADSTNTPTAGGYEFSIDTGPTFSWGPSTIAAFATPLVFPCVGQSASSGTVAVVGGYYNLSTTPNRALSGRIYSSTIGASSWSVLDLEPTTDQGAYGSLGPIAACAAWVDESDDLWIVGGETLTSPLTVVASIATWTASISSGNTATPVNKGGYERKTPIPFISSNLYYPSVGLFQARWSFASEFTAHTLVVGFGADLPLSSNFRYELYFLHAFDDNPTEFDFFGDYNGRGDGTCGPRAFTDTSCYQNTWNPVGYHMEMIRSRVLNSPLKLNKWTEFMLNTTTIPPLPVFPLFNESDFAPAIINATITFELDARTGNYKFGIPGCPAFGSRGGALGISISGSDPSNSDLYLRTGLYPVATLIGQDIKNCNFTPANYHYYYSSPAQNAVAGRNCHFVFDVVSLTRAPNAITIVANSYLNTTAAVTTCDFCVIRPSWTQGARCQFAPPSSPTTSSKYFEYTINDNTIVVPEAGFVYPWDTQLVATENATQGNPASFRNTTINGDLVLVLSPTSMGTKLELNGCFDFGRDSQVVLRPTLTSTDQTVDILQKTGVWSIVFPSVCQLAASHTPTFRMEYSIPPGVTCHPLPYSPTMSTAAGTGGSISKLAFGSPVACGRCVALLEDQPPTVTCTKSGDVDIYYLANSTAGAFRVPYLASNTKLKLYQSTLNLNKSLWGSGVKRALTCFWINGTISIDNTNTMPIQSGDTPFCIGESAIFAVTTAGATTGWFSLPNVVYYPASLNIIMTVNGTEACATSTASGSPGVRWDYSASPCVPPTAPVEPTNPLNPDGSAIDDGNGGKVAIGVTVPLVIIIIAAIVFLILFLRHRKRQRNKNAANVVPVVVAEPPAETKPKSSKKHSKTPKEDENTYGAIAAPAAAADGAYSSLPAATEGKKRKTKCKTKKAEIEFEMQEQQFREEDAARLERVRANATKGFKEEWMIKFEDLQFEKKLGQGAFGIVYRGKWLQTRVAIKQSNMMVADEEAIEAFKKEAILVLSLRPHPAVVQVFGISVHETNIYMILDFCSKGSLDTYFGKELLSLEQKLKILSGFAMGIQHLHNNKIVHRDLAARNILLNHAMQPKISDFGMSRMVDQFEKKGVTASNIGPLKYMAPESLKDKSYSFQTDIYTFGVVVAEILNEEEPFSDIDLLEAGIKIRDQSLVPSLPSDCPGWLENLVRKCWNRDASQRPTIADIVEVFTKNVSLDESDESSESSS